MATNNFGIIKATFTNYMNESENLLAKEMFGKFMNLIKESKFLRTEFEVYKNLENKHIPNEYLAIKYIDENIHLLSSLYTKDHAINEHAKLPKLIEGLDVKVSSSRKELYEHIDTLIFESLIGDGIADVDKLHESLSFILEYIKNNKPQLKEYNELTPEIQAVPKDFLIKKAIQKFNDRYVGLNENDKQIFKSILSSNNEDKENVFILIKEDTITKLESLIGKPDIEEDRINESVTRIEKMSFNIETYSNDIISLNTLNKDITQ